MYIVGIIGKLNTGKDTVASVFKQQGFDSRSFADPVKEVVQDLFDIPSEVLWGPSEARTGEVRQMLQELGTDYARKFRSNVWVDKMEKCLDILDSTVGVIIPDVRFLNEMEMLVNRGAYLIRVVRPRSNEHETDQANSHQSEAEQDYIPDDLFFETINNVGSVQDLRVATETIIGDILNVSSR